ncbi:MAG TPA: sulfotransferase family 2 domain-containing protein, partial [Xanthomonadaceae bacterium]|nr:sulfotransferase family 2 domain-containing protein [Xanthomonadaceae bacterium]
MIISHKHRFIFFAIPKTGTHSLRKILRPYLGESDAEQVALFEKKALPYPEIAALKHGHITAQQIRWVVGEETFDAYFKFAIVRNPFDRFVSYCAFMLRGGDVFEQQPREVMRHFLFDAPPERHILFQPQASLLVGEDGATLLADRVGRVEDMQGSYDAICA